MDQANTRNRTGRIMRAGMLAGIGGLAAIPARATPLQDPYGTWTIQAENDAVSTLKGTSDQYYTSGLRINWTSGTDNQPAPIETLNHAILGPGVTRISLGVQQTIFTPHDTQAVNPPAGDRPYAGLMLGTVNLINDTDLSRSVFGIQFGVMGPAALGRQLQNGFHNLIGDTPNRGWSHQLQNQPIFQVQAGRTWRLPLADLYGIEMEMLPAVAAAAGDYRIYGSVADTFRLGQGLRSDFGTPTIGSGTDGTDAYRLTRPLAWYVFGNVTGYAVGYDATLQGNTVRNNSPHVPVNWDVGEIHAGVAVMWHGMRLSYSQTWQTQQFRGARSGLFNFGSVDLSAKF